MLTVKKSPIHGHGLFATTRIAKGTVLGTLQGRRTRKDGPYVLWLDDETGYEVQNDLKYINHAARPNAAYFDDLTVVALRTIKPGEEITHNYLGDGQLTDQDAAVFS